jgi:flavin-dependent dehydrogenase
MNKPPTYDVTITGGGLAGLCCAILLAKNNYRVALFEKETYPFHKVCGEYISFESYDLLISLGIKLNEMVMPVIKHVTVSSVNGNVLDHQLPLGGFGISRYWLDCQLAFNARKYGVDVYENTKVNDIRCADELMTIHTDKEIFTSAVACAAYGKRSNVDVKRARAFTLQKRNALNNYIAVKYHALTSHSRNNIALHNFKNGYCGVSPVEENKTCICYLTTAQNLRQSGNSIQQMEEKVLMRNPLLKKILKEAKIIYERPLTISQVSFEKKTQVEEHVLFLGDAAGLIAPLCGNGMSMALHSGRMAAQLIAGFLQREFDRNEMEKMYACQWRNTFSRRLHAGRIIQSLFGNPLLTNGVINFLRHYPSLMTKIIRQTHG